MGKTTFQALGVGLVIAGVMELFWYIQSTAQYVPDVVRMYESVDLLQHQTAVGGSKLARVIMTVVLAVVGMVGFVGIKRWRRKRV